MTKDIQSQRTVIQSNIKIKFIVNCNEILHITQSSFIEIFKESNGPADHGKI